MDLLFTLLATLVALGLLVTIHEYGHFWVARRCGVRVLRFSIGFGAPLYRWYDRHGTEFMIASIPLGGYVKMLDEREAEVPVEQLDQAFNRKSVKQRIAIVAAGPLANFLLALLAFWVVAVVGLTTVKPVTGVPEAGSIAERAGLREGLEIVAIDGATVSSWHDINLRLIRRLGESGTLGISARELAGGEPQNYSLVLDGWLRGVDQPDPLGALGLTSWQPQVLPRIGQVNPDGAAQRAGLQVDDLIVRVDGVPVNDWVTGLVPLIQTSPGQPLALEVERGGRLIELTLVPDGRESDQGLQGFAGVGVAAFEWPDHMLRRISYNPLLAIPVAAGRTWDMTVLTLESLQKMLTGLVSAKNLSGPITIAKVAGASARSGLESFLSFIAYLSISLGVLNLLPIPVLDGGHLLFYAAEWVRGKPLSERIQAWGLQIGLALILCIMLFAIYNDLSRLGG